MMTSLPLLLLIVDAVVAGRDAASSSDYWRRPVTHRARDRINVAGLIPLTSPGTDETSPGTGDGRASVDDGGPAPDVLQAVNMAISDVNRNRSILPNHDLHLDWRDSKVCDPATLCLMSF